MSLSRGPALVMLAGACLVAGYGQDAERIRKLMANSLRQQRESVQKQIESVSSSMPPRASSAGDFQLRAAKSVPSFPRRFTANACPGTSPSSFAGEIAAVSERQGLSADLLKAVVRQESGFNPCAVSPKGALGLMQLMPATAASLGVENPFDPKQSLESGARFLGQLLRRYDGDVKRALSAYNAGPSVADKYRSVPPIPETQNYVQSIMKSVSLDPVVP